MRYPTKSSLPDSCRRLLEEMQNLNFGRLEHLAVRNGEPVFSPPPRVYRELKFGGDNDPRPEAAAKDFLLKPQVRELFERISQLKEAVIESLEIRHGIPFRMTIEEPFAG